MTDQEPPEAESPTAESPKAESPKADPPKADPPMIPLPPPADPGARCPWCSAPVTGPDAVTCSSCGATLHGDAEVEVPGVTAIDDQHASRASAPRKVRRSFGSLFVGGDEAIPPPSEAELPALAMPAADVRREMLRLRLDAELADLTARVEALAAERGIPMPAVPGAGPEPERAADPATEPGTAPEPEPAAEAATEPGAAPEPAAPGGQEPAPGPGTAAEPDGPPADQTRPRREDAGP